MVVLRQSKEAKQKRLEDFLRAFEFRDAFCCGHKQKLFLGNGEYGFMNSMVPMLLETLKTAKMDRDMLNELIDRLDKIKKRDISKGNKVHRVYS